MAKINKNQIYFNTAFIPCLKDEIGEEAELNHCIIFEFENYPFIAKSRKKSYLEIERFSFYKESAEYLIAPFTKFLVSGIEQN